MKPTTTSSRFESWEEQWHRTLRYLERLRRTAVGKLVPVDPWQELDDAYSFFLNCYHLKDWLRSDPTFQRAGEVESFVSNSAALSLCGDIANSVKHLQVDRPRTGVAPKGLVGSFAAFSSETFAFDGKEREFARGVIYVEHKESLKPALRLAEEAIADWMGFLQ